MKLTNSQEEYLKVIYILASEDKTARVTDIARNLNITKSSVNKGIKALKEMQLINYEAYGEIILTEKGRKVAAAIIKKFDIIKIFLKEILEVPEEQAKKEATAMKTSISKETEEKLEKYIIKTLKLNELECGYNMDSEKCRRCARLGTKKQCV